MCRSHDHVNQRTRWLNHDHDNRRTQRLNHDNWRPQRLNDDDDNRRTQIEGSVGYCYNGIFGKGV